VYKTITEFVVDMRLLLENCYRFNGPDHSVSRKAQRIETLLEQKLALLSRFSFCHFALCLLLGKKICRSCICVSDVVVKFIDI